MSGNVKLFKVCLRGFNYSTGTNYGLSYVIAKDPTEAYNKVRGFMDSKEIGFPKDRELLSVELIAEAVEYPDCKTMLFI